MRKIDWDFTKSSSVAKRPRARYRGFQFFVLAAARPVPCRNRRAVEPAIRHLSVSVTAKFGICASAVGASESGIFRAVYSTNQEVRLAVLVSSEIRLTLKCAAFFIFKKLFMELTNAWNSVRRTQCLRRCRRGDEFYEGG